MAEFSFLFYPGDYLKDTQCLSEKSQVAYDRIMCEHMRNICIPKTKINFFTKRLAPDEIEEVMHVLTACEGGFQITWVAESITKRKGFVESRRSNRSSKPKEHMTNISKSYDEHKEIVIVIEKEIVNKIEKEKGYKGAEKKLIFPFDSDAFKSAWGNLLTQKKWAKKSELALQASLKKLSVQSEADAIQMIENTIAGEWQGLFELKPGDKPKSTSISHRIHVNKLVKEQYPDESTGS